MCAQCGGGRDKTSDYQRPPIVSRAVDEVLAEIVGHVVDDFFSSWYSQLAFEPDLQAQAIKYVTADCEMNEQYLILICSGLLNAFFGINIYVCYSDKI